MRMENCVIAKNVISAVSGFQKKTLKSQSEDEKNAEVAKITGTNEKKIGKKQQQKKQQKKK